MQLGASCRSTTTAHGSSPRISLSHHRPTQHYTTQQRKNTSSSSIRHTVLYRDLIAIDVRCEPPTHPASYPANPFIDRWSG